MIGSRSGRLAAFVVALTLLLPLAAAAQDVPSYARPADTLGTDETIHGRIRSVDGAFRISVDDDRGFVDAVQLHPGTIINPTGLTLGEGMSVTILGVNAGAAFEANEIDTPYDYAGPVPSPVYYGPGYWCPGFGYGYGPAFSLAIVIGGGYHPWSYEQRPFYGRPWDGHGYFGAAVGLAPPNHGRLVTGPAPGRPGVRTPMHNGDTAPGSHVPPAFAGRTFAGESRSTYTQDVETSRFGSAQTGRDAAVPAWASRTYGSHETPGATSGRQYGGRRSAPSNGAAHTAPSHGGAHPH